jgi:hypothetical protein
MSAFGFGYSNGQFWYGRSTGFPGFLYKKNVGVGGRRSTKMTPGGNITCNSYTYLYNKYKPGTGGVGASSIANRRAKNRLATVCDTQKCFPCYMTLGQYSNYTHNPNGYIPCQVCPSYSVTGEYTQLPRTTEYSNVIQFTGNGILTVIDAPLYVNTVVVLTGEPNPFIIKQIVYPGNYPINIIVGVIESITLSFNTC